MSRLSQEQWHRKVVDEFLAQRAAYDANPVVAASRKQTEAQYGKGSYPHAFDQCGASATDSTGRAIPSPDDTRAALARCRRGTNLANAVDASVMAVWMRERGY